MVHRYLIALLLGSFLVVSAWSQDSEPQPGDTDESQVEEEAVEQDDSDLDEQSYSDDDDDFRPSEDIPADQSIAFPTDI